MSLNAEYQAASRVVAARGEPVSPPLSREVQQQIDREAAEVARRQREAEQWQSENQRMQRRHIDSVDAAAKAALEDAEREAVERREAEKRRREAERDSPVAEERAAQQASKMYQRF